MNNILKQHYSPWRYPCNWWKNIRLFFRRYKWAYQRATRGFCDCDIWDLDGFYLNLFHDSLKELARISSGWPGNEQFPEYEDWIKYLNEMADKFYRANEWNEYYPTPEEDNWSDWCDKNGWNVNDKTNPYGKAMFEESKMNFFKRQTDFAEAWKMMGKVFFHLWD